MIDKDPVVDKQVEECKALIAENIIEELNKKRWTPHEISKLTGISPGTISGILGLRSAISIRSLLKICDAFEMSWSRIFAKDDKEIHDAKKRELLAEFERLTPVQQDKLLDFVKNAM